MDFLFDTALYIIVPTLLVVIQRQANRINKLTVKASKLQAEGNIKAQTPEDKLDDLFQAYEELFSRLPVHKQIYEEPVTSQPINKTVEAVESVESDDYWTTVEVEIEAPSATGSKEMNNVVRFLPVQKQPLLLAPALSLPTVNAGCAVLDLNQLSVRELRAMCKGEQKYQGYSKAAKKGKKQLIKFMMGC